MKHNVGHEDLPKIQRSECGMVSRIILAYYRGLNN